MRPRIEAPTEGELEPMPTAEAMTVADLVSEAPLRAGVFERHQIDYCCNGGRTLREVCAEKGLDVEALVAELETTPPAGESRDWKSAPLAELAHHIVATHHEYLRSTLPSVGKKLDRVVAVHGARHEFLHRLEVAFRALEAELVPHMAKEEMVLFPLIGAIERAANEGSPPPPAPGGSVQNPIRMMMMEHDNAGNMLAQIRSATSDLQPPADACNTFRALYAQLEELEKDTHTHIHLENNILFPRAAELEGAPRQ